MVAAERQTDLGRQLGRGSRARAITPTATTFYLPRLCNHCENPACLAACSRNAIYKRQEDGIVLIDQERCRGYRYCVSACPYKKVYFNEEISKSEKCIFCYPRIEKGPAHGLRQAMCWPNSLDRLSR